MTIRSRSTARTAVLTLATCVGLLGVPTVANADPHPWPDPCRAALARAVIWPGFIGDGPQRYHVFSDAYFTHALGSPRCATPPTGTADDPGICVVMTGYGLQRYPC